ncbi:MAG: hypothetical protein JW839_11535 [Candidatus Lokiarchaeota archaeon]|nr:hypothetical protein [Candidatus Lokiarchaeota archaeon]
MNRQTIDAPVRGGTFSIAPGKPGSGIVINGIPVRLANIIHGDHRVDIRQGRNVALIVEHPVAVATLFGIHDAAITGNRQTWDFYRAADREAHARGLKPDAVLGLADGSIGGDMAGPLGRAATVDGGLPLDLHTVAERVEIEKDDGNWVSIQPPAPGARVLNVAVSMFNLGPLQATLDPVKGLLDITGSGDIRFEILRARSAAVIGLKEEALLHALGDVVADIAGTGGIRAGSVEARLTMGYHKATIGLVQKLVVSSMVVPLD